MGGATVIFRERGLEITRACHRDLKQDIFRMHDSRKIHPVAYPHAFPVFLEDRRKMLGVSMLATAKQERPPFALAFKMDISRPSFVFEDGRFMLLLSADNNGPHTACAAYNDANYNGPHTACAAYDIRKSQQFAHGVCGIRLGAWP